MGSRNWEGGSRNDAQAKSERGGTPARHPALRLPKSAFGNRSGVSLIEVLISMGILAVGLLGVASVFPVGSYYLQKTEEYDRADALAQSALNDAITRGMLNPENWVAFEDRAAINTAQGYPPSGSNQLIPLGTEFTYTRPFAADYRARLKHLSILNSISPRDKAASINASVGSVIVIDPLGVASGMAPLTSATPARFTTEPRMGAFPSGVQGIAAALRLPRLSVGVGATSSYWLPWAKTGCWPIQRVSVQSRQSVTTDKTSAIGFEEADAVVTTNDDLAIELGDDADQPPQQLLEQAGGNALLRQARREYSWMITVAPTSLEAHRALATGGGGAYSVSAVVQHKRSLATGPNDADLTSLMQSERIARASVTTSTTSGGEVLLLRGERQTFPTPPSAPIPGADPWWQDPLGKDSAPWKDLRAGQWIMLFGPSPHSTNERPQLFAQWYRVLAVDRTNEEKPAGAPNTWRSSVSVALRGPDWPWTQGDNTPTDANPDELSEALHAIIVPDVIAVHTRTLNLKSGSAWQTE